jgi:AcrR family transcriptional regulator
MLKETILASAIRLARIRSIEAVTRRKVAKSAGCGVGTINYHFESIAVLRGAVVTHAIQTEDVEILTHLVGDSRIMGRLTPALKERIAARIAGK